MAEDYQNTTSGSCSDQTTLNGTWFLCLLRFGKLSLGYAENVFVQGLCEYVALSIANRRSIVFHDAKTNIGHFSLLFFLLIKNPKNWKNNNSNNQNQNKNKSKKLKKKVILFGALS